MYASPPYPIPSPPCVTRYSPSRLLRKRRARKTAALTRLSVVPVVEPADARSERLITRVRRGNRTIITAKTVPWRGTVVRLRGRPNETPVRFTGITRTTESRGDTATARSYRAPVIAAAAAAGSIGTDYYSRFSPRVFPPRITIDESGLPSPAARPTGIF